MGRKYTDVQLLWLKNNASAKTWKNREDFRRTFNKTFRLDVPVYAFNNLVSYYDLHISTEQCESIFTEEQKKWLIENAQSGMFANCKELTKTYNAIFNQSRDYNNIYSYLYHWGIKLVTRFFRYTDEMDEWLRENYEQYTNFNVLTERFNERFNLNQSSYAIQHRCNRHLNLRRKENHRFKINHKPPQTKKIGEIVVRKDKDYIKVNDNGDKRSWIPLNKKIYEDHYGSIPDGYCVIALDGNERNHDIDNLFCIDRRGTAIMAKQGWWTENRALTACGAQWCNLYMELKDHNGM